LRVLETKRFSRVGSAREIEVDARIVAATHRDLEAMVEARTFRADLYYRLNTMTLKVPPLRDRKEEIMPLARALLAQTVERWNTSARDFAPETQTLLCNYRWPGNVRELRNVIERAAVISTTDRLEPEDLPERVRAPSDPGSVVEQLAGLGLSIPTMGPSSLSPSSLPPPLPPMPPGAGVPVDDDGVAFRDRIRDYELKLITDALTAAGGNQSRAAELLRMPLRTLVHKIRSYGLKKTYKRDGE
jgi:DNA-binding NtrC family response regulator